MPDMPSLQQLVAAISSSVLQAQQQVESAQLNNLMSYFRVEKGKGFVPLSIDINLPSLRPDALPGDTDLYRAPYLALLPYSTLRIKQVDVDFDVAFSGLELAASKGEETEAQDGESGNGSEALPNVSLDLNALRKGSNYMAHVKLTLEGNEAPEGAARLINELIKSSQTYAARDNSAEGKREAE